jgi:hypothetical protein
MSQNRKNRSNTWKYITNEDKEHSDRHSQTRLISPVSMTTCILANGHNLPRPTKIECFVQTVKQHNPTCSCNEHDPTSYNTATSCSVTHQIILWPPYWSTIDKSEPPVLKKDKSCEALHLARVAVRWIATPKTHMDDKRAVALARFREASLLLGMEGRDACKGVPISRVLDILQTYNDSFFSGAVDYSFIGTICRHAIASVSAPQTGTSKWIQRSSAGGRAPSSRRRDDCHA